jgi:hypothetical protein
MATQQTITAFGVASEILVLAGSKIAIGTYDGTARISYKSGPGNNNPDQYYFQQSLTNGEVLLGTFAADRLVQIEAGNAPVIYSVGTAPVLTRLVPKVSLEVQGAPAAKTVSATLTAAELLTKLITVNQGAAGASALQLPLATALDTALPDSVADSGFKFSLINISTVGAEDASITTNTGWTLVGNMDVASNAAAADKSVGRFFARKTATGAWTLYRIS